MSSRLRRLTQLVIMLAISSCASVKSVSASPPSLRARADAIDWARARREVVELLSAYLRVDTVNPPGNERAGTRFLAEFLEREGVESTQWDFAPGRSNLVARLRAAGTPTQKPLCLLSHVDVVSAEPAQWPVETQPLSGAISNGFLWGRGALDMKGMGALEVMTLVLLERAQVPLQRDVVLIAVGDEEVENLGMKSLIAQHWPELDCGVLVNEGGVGLKNLLAQGQTVYPISVAEKGVLWARLIARGEAGHGSVPLATRAPSRLMKALERLATRDPAVTIDPSIYELLARAGAQEGGLEGFVLSHPTLVDLFAKGRLLALPPTRATITDTCQVTGFEGQGSAPNVVPSETAAILDCRLLPGTSPQTLLAQLRTLMNGLEGITVEASSEQPATSSTWDDPLFEALERHLREGHPEVVVGPALSPGFTDSNLARPLGVRAYGLVPFELDAELLATMHGANERVPVAEVEHGLEVLFRAVLDVAGQP